MPSPRPHCKQGHHAAIFAALRTRKPLHSTGTRHSPSQRWRCRAGRLRVDCNGKQFGIFCSSAVGQWVGHIRCGTVNVIIGNKAHFVGRGLRDRPPFYTTILPASWLDWIRGNVGSTAVDIGRCLPTHNCQHACNMFTSKRKRERDKLKKE